MRDFYAAALIAGGQPNGAPAFRGINDCIFNAAVLDLDGNSIEVIYHQLEDEDAYTTVSGGSRVLTWRKGIVNVLGDEDRTTFVSARSGHPEVEDESATSVAESIPRSKAPSIARTTSTPAAQATPESNSGFQITGKAIIGTILGAAAGAAVAYAMVKSEQDSAQQEADFAEAIGRKSASSRASSKVPSKYAPSQAQTSKAETVLSSATTSKTAKRSPEQFVESVKPRPRTRVHRNYSTTDSVVTYSVMEQFGDIESEVALRPLKARSVRAIEAAPEPQTIDTKSYHSPTYVSLAPTSRVGKKSENAGAVYIPASHFVTQTSSRSPSGPPSVAPTEKQIEYIPASLVGPRPSILSRRAVTSPPSICNTDRQIEDITIQAPERPSQELVVARRDSAMSMYSAHSSKSKHSRHSHRDAPRSNHDERRYTSPDRASISSHRSSKHRTSSVVSHRSEHRASSPDRSSRYRDSSRYRATTSKMSSKHRSGAHRDESPYDGSDTSTTKASQVNGSRYYSAAGVPLPESRRTSIVTAAELPLPSSRKTSVVSAADYVSPISRKTSIVSGVDMPLPDSRRPSLASAMERPLPMSRAASTVSAHQIALPESRAGSIIGSILGRQVTVQDGASAASVPLPESRKTSLVGSLLESDPIPQIDDLETVAPDDSISCVASRHARHERDESGHRDRSHDRESRKSSSSKKHRSSSLHGQGSRRSSRHSEAGSDATVRPSKSSRYSAASLPVHARSRTGIERDEKRGQRSFVSVAFGGR